MDAQKNWKIKLKKINISNFISKSAEISGIFDGCSKELIDNTHIKSKFNYKLLINKEIFPIVAYLSFCLLLYILYITSKDLNK